MNTRKLLARGYSLFCVTPHNNVPAVSYRVWARSEQEAVEVAACINYPRTIQYIVLRAAHQRYSTVDYIA